MGRSYPNKSNLEDFKVNVRVKISTLWTVLMFCYIYADYFELYVPGKLTDMLAGNIGPLGQVTQAKLAGTTILLAIPTLLIFLSVVLSPRVTKWINIIFGTLYSLVALATMSATNAWIFYKLFCVIEILVTLTIVWHAWNWPRQRTAEKECS